MWDFALQHVSARGACGVAHIVHALVANDMDYDHVGSNYSAAVQCSYLSGTHILMI